MGCAGSVITIFRSTLYPPPATLGILVVPMLLPGFHTIPPNLWNTSKNSLFVSRHSKEFYYFMPLSRELSDASCY